MAPKVVKHAVLSAEAAAMELKLAELRKAMEKEREKRESLMANAGGGSIWRNGSANGGLRTNVKGKGPGEGSAPSASAQASSARRPGSGEAPSGTGFSAPRASSARAVGSTADSEIPAVSGSRLDSARAAVLFTSEQKGGVSSGAQGRVVASGGGGGGSSGSGAVGGMSCGTDDNNSLADGAFNEADSHRSFLEALNEWRRANRDDAGVEGEGQAVAATTSTSDSRGKVPQRPGSARQSATLEIQTDYRPAPRPSSAKPLSYFDKLIINASSRVAGHLASGGPPEALRTSLSGQATGLPPRPTSTSRLPVPPAQDLSNEGAAAASRVTAVQIPETSSLNSSATFNSTPFNAPAAGGSDGVKAPLPDPLSILDRLEALERQRQAIEDDDEHDEMVIQVTTATGLMLTKATRLPDEVLVPGNGGY